MDDEEHTPNTSNSHQPQYNIQYGSTDSSVLITSADSDSTLEKCSDDPKSNTNIYVSKSLPLFYDKEGNLYVWKEFFYSLCHKFFGRQTTSCLQIVVKGTLVCLLLCYLLMLGMLVWYFKDFYGYGFFNALVVVIAGGMLPKVLKSAFDLRASDLQKTEDCFQIFVQKEIEALCRNVLLFVGRTGNGKTSSIRSILKNGTTAPRTSTTAPGTSTTTPGTSTTAPGTSTTAPGTSTKAPVTSTKAPVTSTKAPGTSTTAPGTSTTAPGTSTTAPGTSTTAPVTSTTAADPSKTALDSSTTAPGTSTTAPGTSTTAPGTSTTAPGTSTIQPGSDTTTHTVGDLEMIDGTGIGDNGEDMIVNAEDLVKSISRKLTNGFTALVFVVKYGVRFTKQEMDAVETVKSIFGNDVFEKWGIILMTYGDNFYLDHDDDPKSFKAWCLAQSGGFKNLFDECNKRCVLFNNKTTDPLELEKQRELLMEQVEAVRELSSGLYTCAHLKSAERSRNFWARKNKGKVTYNTFN